MSFIDEPVFLLDQTPCQLKTFTSEDLNDILSIEQAAAPYPWSAANFRSSLASSHWCVGIQIRDTGEPQWVAQSVMSLAAREAELLILSVHPQWQRKGIAKMLLQNVLRLLSGHADNVFLEVRESNTAAQALYESLGFNGLGCRTNYYPAKNGREDACIYGMTLCFPDTSDK